MKYLILFMLLLGFRSVSSGQEIFGLDFNAEFVPEGWSYSDKSEWGRRLGENGTSYFRFHPFSYRDYLQSPLLELEEGYYVLHFSWNESRRGNPDFCNVRLRSEGGFWDIVHSFGSGNDRQWERDSAVLGNLPAGTYQIEFEYKSLPRYPAQYLNLDNIALQRGEVVVTAASSNAWLHGLELRPNPVSDFLHYELAGAPVLPEAIRIVNAAGQSLLEVAGPQAIGSIDVSSLPAGHYFLEVGSGGARAAKPFVILR